MEKKSYLNKNYKNFKEFLSKASSMELQSFILNSKFKNRFNLEVKGIIDDIKSKGNVLEVSSKEIIFNSKGEISIISSRIIGEFIGSKYEEDIIKYYKNTGISRVIHAVIDGNEKVQGDFIKISYKVLHDILNIIYYDLNFIKDISEEFKEKYILKDKNNNISPISMISLFIVEDICMYLGIPLILFRECIIGFKIT
ncbi:hypothetical protein [Clostridium hydrogeniformans]|uniref:hypothetical protein n=1 Tax=Clostridium hydrogeniformans TaxID=349933 RepID=UPI00068AA381|nr:hypothetical protein [Clostridium hydrogeniformans]